MYLPSVLFSDRYAADSVVYMLSDWRVAIKCLSLSVSVAIK